ncbi:MAG: hypothetical protein GX495_07830 [Chloroflexi bacterium]|jgi:hypothetical protein|nr:hypothetical protein [Chloroflexota bacterium]
MLPISLDTHLAKKLEQGMRSGDAAELPFPVVYVWALNGQPGMKQQGNASYYGGWACKAEDLQTIADQQGLPIPSGWKQVTIASRDGDEYEAYTTRHVIVAPIGRRESWLLDGKRFADYVDGGRRHLQVLAYMAESQGDNGNRQFIPWGPVVLTAKGYQARNLLDAFARWDKATAPLRWKIAPGVPAWCFYLSLGTFGKERQSVNVGKPGAQSPITPITAYIPERMTEELLASLFVGHEVAAVMSDLQDQAGEWLKAWREENILVESDDYNEGVYQTEEEIPF